MQVAYRCPARYADDIATGEGSPMLGTETTRKPRRLALMRGLRRDWLLYGMMLPGLIYYFLFCYVPMGGALIAFRDYSVFRGMADAPFVGLKHFESLFAKSGFLRALENNIMISFLKLLIGFPVPVMLALMINEIHARSYKKWVQTTVILPNFVSWVVISGLLFAIFSTNSGAIAGIIRGLGYRGQIPSVLTNKNTFRWVIVFSDIWKNAGMGTVIYLSAITSVNHNLYEAAMIDGANRWRQTWHVTLPAIRGTVIVMLILRVGNIMDAGFDQIFAISNSLVKPVADIIDTYVYELGLVQRKYSLAAAAGLFKSAISLMLVVGANVISKRIDSESGIV